MSRCRWIAGTVAVAALVALPPCAWVLAAAKGKTQSKPPVKARREAPLPGSVLAKCLKSGRPTMADFGRGWCKPCKMMVPVLKQAVSDYRGKANIVFVELGEYGSLARQHRIMMMPTQVFFDARGKEVERHIGYIDNEGIDKQLAKMGVRK